jgi:hypothetical protein
MGAGKIYLHTTEQTEGEGVTVSSIGAEIVYNLAIGASLELFVGLAEIGAGKIYLHTTEQTEGEGVTISSIGAEIVYN